MAHLFTRLPDVHSALVSAYFGNKQCPLVVGIVLHDTKNAFLVESARAPSGVTRFTFPQETAEFRKDNTFHDVAVRCLEEELGVPRSAVTVHPECISWFENHLPLRRTNGVKTTKCMVYVSARLTRQVKFHLNPAEVRRLAKVPTSDGYFMVCQETERARPSKWIGQTDALVAAVTRNLIEGVHWNHLRRLGGGVVVH